MHLRFHLVLVCMLAAALSSAQSKKQDAYRYTVDISRVVDDRVHVELTPPKLNGSEVTFYLPKIVPGTYAIADYGRYVNELTAVDKKGRKLPVEKVDENTWKIKDAGKLEKISYWVDDTYDTQVEGPEIFWPAGTNIEDDSNFIINTGGFFGYFEGIKEIPFEFSVIRDKDHYGSTGLIPLETGKPLSSVKREKASGGDGKVVDVYRAEDYDQLIDSPLMYSEPDTAVIQVANTEVLIGSYSPNGVISADEIAGSMRDVLMAQKEYLGGTLPVDKYAFIFYFTDQSVTSFGALEHSYSSMYFMPEAPIAQMNQQLQEVAAHEFFHILTPLTVHSDEIANFDFNEPRMSRHLWLYEGATEYFASNVLVRHDLISAEEYLQILQEKMFTSDRFNDSLSFTEMSKRVLEEEFHEQYTNVYYKGALIGLCLDIRLRQLSGGDYGLRNLVLDLSKKYGKDRAFDDDKLFDEITKMTYPEIGEFIERYIRGSEPLPLDETFQAVGILYQAEEKYMDYSMGIGNADIGVTHVGAKPMLQIASTEHLNEMGRMLGFKKGDVLTAINGDTIPDLGPELGMFIQKHVMSLPMSKSLSYTVLREDSTGALNPVELSAPVTQVQLTRRHLMQFDPEATDEQLALRDAWLKP